MTQNDLNIKCPQCGTRIDVDDILYHQIEHDIKGKYEQQITNERLELKSKEEKLRTIQDNFLKEKELFESKLKEEVAVKLNEKLIIERKKILQDIEREKEEQFKSMNDELLAKTEKLKELNQAKAEVEKLKREKDQIKAEIELASEKKLSELIHKERETISKQERERSEMSLREREKVIDSLKEQLNEAQRKAAQGSMQLQGEVQELAIEEWLSAQFPLDTITEIKKGARGGDCIQIVNTRAAQNCGLIYYESKRTKDFQPAWIEKFKLDMQTNGAEIGVIVTEAMPKDMERMGLREGIWICSFPEFKGLCFVLRETIIKLSRAISSQENKGDKMVMLYDYLTSNEFKLQIEGIVDGFTQMKSDLEREKRSMMNIWKNREKQLDKVLLNTIGMHGSIKGIAGNAIQTIKALELPLDDDIGEEMT